MCMLQYGSKSSGDSGMELELVDDDLKCVSRPIRSGRCIWNTTEARKVPGCDNPIMNFDQ